jgi:two-component sensor histidine kinase
MLDTPPEEQFQRVVDLARVLFDAPRAAISLISEDRQWFKARAGIAKSETSRADSFCQFTIQGNSPLVVADARLDPRFMENPLVVGEDSVRFYAGAPLRTPGGHNLGALCIISDIPRPDFTLTDARRLEVLAAIVVNEMELKLQAKMSRRVAEENELLLREVHHRIKNSLQLVNVVLQAQASRTGAEATREALNDAADRVVTIGTVHRLLYRSKSIRSANATNYISMLTAELKRVAGHKMNTQRITLDAPSDLNMSAEALPKVGLIVTELLMNAFRHGAGGVTVSLRQEAATVVVGVSDEGSGFPEEFDPAAKRTSLGFHLVRQLAEPEGVWIDAADRRKVFARVSRGV